MKNTSDMPVLTLSGSPLTRGRIHGEALREKIWENINRTRAFMGEGLRKSPDEAIAAFLAETRFLPAIQRWTPFLIDEMQGIAEGAGAEFNDVYLLNLSDEAWWYFMEKEGAFSSPVVGAESCTSLGLEARPGMPAIVAQNLDLPDYYDGLQTLLHIQDAENDMEAYAVSFAGVVGAVGLNSRGVGMCENTLIHLKHSPDGLPVMHVSRGILAQPTLEDAIAFVHMVRHASGQNYIIGSPDGVVDYECSANKVRRFLPYEAAPLVYHTNHALVNEDAFPMGREPENSQARFGCVAASVAAAGTTLGVESIKQALSSHASAPHEICVHPSENKHGITASCLIMELGEHPRLHYTAGPPCETDFLTVAFDPEG